MVMENDLAIKAVTAAGNKPSVYCKFLSANDSGETGGHQAGILISTSAKGMLFSKDELQGKRIPKKTGTIKWQDNFHTGCTLTWYESKHELRITGFGKGFPFRGEEYTGALFVLIKDNEEEYQGFVFNTDDGIRGFLDSFGLTPADTNKPIQTTKIAPVIREEQDFFDAFISGLTTDFPTTSEMSRAARKIQRDMHRNHRTDSSCPDNMLLSWIECEYRLFRAIEHARYGETITNGFHSVDDFITTANQVLNRRKSRAGKSLEHHLSAIFDENSIQYAAQATTEGKKRPDFLFPSEEAYHDKTFSIEKICTLAAKTTCKDRWRQILNEANRLRDKNKYICTTQQGISRAQMDEMQQEKVILVVPQEHIKHYPKDRQDRIWTVGKFVRYVKEMQCLP